MTELMSLLGLMVTAGYLMRRTGLVRPELASDLSKVVFYLTLPPLIFLALNKANLAWSMLMMPMVAWVYLLVGIAAGLLITKLMRMPGPKAGALIIVTLCGNTTFFGYPIVQGFYGQSGLTLAIFYDLLGASLVINTVLLLVASHLGGKKLVSGVDMLRQLVRLPPIWGLILGILFTDVDLPTWLARVIESVGNLTTPLIMLSIGLSLRFSAWREDLCLVAIATVLRLAIIPLFVWLVLTGLGFPEEMLRVAVLQAGMPTMFFSLTLALLFGLHKSLVVNAIMLSTLLSFATLPLWRLLLGP